jgi:hypothetical protein
LPKSSIAQPSLLRQRVHPALAAEYFTSDSGALTDIELGDLLSMVPYPHLVAAHELSQKCATIEHDHDDGGRRLIASKSSARQRPPTSVIEPDCQVIILLVGQSYPLGVADPYHTGVKPWIETDP